MEQNLNQEQPPAESFPVPENPNQEHTAGSDGSRLNFEFWSSVYKHNAKILKSDYLQLQQQKQQHSKDRNQLLRRQLWLQSKKRVLNQQHEQLEERQRIYEKHDLELDQLRIFLERFQRQQDAQQDKLPEPQQQYKQLQQEKLPEQHQQVQDLLQQRNHSSLSTKSPDKCPWRVHLCQHVRLNGQPVYILQRPDRLLKMMNIVCDENGIKLNLSDGILDVDDILQNNPDHSNCFNIQEIRDREDVDTIEDANNYEGECR